MGGEESFIIRPLLLTHTHAHTHERAFRKCAICRELIYRWRHDLEKMRPTLMVDRVKGCERARAPSCVCVCVTLEREIKGWKKRRISRSDKSDPANEGADFGEVQPPSVCCLLSLSLSRITLLPHHPLKSRRRATVERARRHLCILIKIFNADKASTIGFSGDSLAGERVSARSARHENRVGVPAYWAVRIIIRSFKHVSAY